MKNLLYIDDLNCRHDPDKGINHKMCGLNDKFDMFSFAMGFFCRLSHEILLNQWDRCGT